MEKGVMVFNATFNNISMEKGVMVFNATFNNISMVKEYATTTKTVVEVSYKYMYNDQLFYVVSLRSERN